MKPNIKTIKTAPSPVSTVDQDLVERVAIFLQMKRPELGNLHVAANEGVVKLRGPVDSYYLRQLAISVTQHVAGVLDVIDKIKVREPHPLEAKPAVRRIAK